MLAAAVGLDGLAGIVGGLSCLSNGAGSLGRRMPGKGWDVGRSSDVKRPGILGPCVSIDRVTYRHTSKNENKFNHQV